jgi:DNA-binding response OmpR family regulator
MRNTKVNTKGTGESGSLQPTDSEPKTNGGATGKTIITSLNAARILVVEDDKVLSELMGDFLQMAGARVWVANTGFEAYERLGRQVFDLVLLDVDLPDASGIDICQWIRTQEQLKNLQVIFCTGNSGAHEMAIKLRAGFLPKAFLMGTLLEEVSNALTSGAPTATTHPAQP